MSATAVIIDLVKGVISELRGSDVSDWTTEKVAKAIADKVAESIAATVASELRVYAAALDIRLAADDLAEAASRLLVRLREAESKPGIVAKALDGVQIEIVGPDGSVEPATVAPIVEDERTP